eukprot:GDKJ01025919.1.p1 GENE.GDKJ01025919.1~~GDKJ01025919.1.p1  ORF type:complete len:906 (-),score=207.92 GDKJ01025919.1:1376-4093(-)
MHTQQTQQVEKDATFEKFSFLENSFVFNTQEHLTYVEHMVSNKKEKLNVVPFVSPFKMIPVSTEDGQSNYVHPQHQLLVDMLPEGDSLLFPPPSKLHKDRLQTDNESDKGNTHGGKEEKQEDVLLEGGHLDVQSHYNHSSIIMSGDDHFLFPNPQPSAERGVLPLLSAANLHGFYGSSLSLNDAHQVLHPLNNLAALSFKNPDSLNNDDGEENNPAHPSHLMDQNGNQLPFAVVLQNLFDASHRQVTLSPFARLPLMETDSNGHPISILSSPKSVFSLNKPSERTRAHGVLSVISNDGDGNVGFRAKHNNFKGSAPSIILSQPQTNNLNGAGGNVAFLSDQQKDANLFLMDHQQKKSQFSFRSSPAAAMAADGTRSDFARPAGDDASQLLLKHRSWIGSFSPVTIGKKEITEESGAEEDEQEFDKDEEQKPVSKIHSLLDQKNFDRFRFYAPFKMHCLSSIYWSSFCCFHPLLRQKVDFSSTSLQLSLLFCTRLMVQILFISLFVGVTEKIPEVTIVGHKTTLAVLSDGINRTTKLFGFELSWRVLWIVFSSSLIAYMITDVLHYVYFLVTTPIVTRLDKRVLNGQLTFITNQRTGLIPSRLMKTKEKIIFLRDVKHRGVIGVVNCLILLFVTVPLSLVFVLAVGDQMNIQQLRDNALTLLSCLFWMLLCKFLLFPLLVSLCISPIIYSAGKYFQQDFFSVADKELTMTESSSPSFGKEEKEEEVSSEISSDVSPFRKGKSSQITPVHQKATDFHLLAATAGQKSEGKNSNAVILLSVGHHPNEFEGREAILCDIFTRKCWQTVALECVMTFDIRLLPFEIPRHLLKADLNKSHRSTDESNNRSKVSNDNNSDRFFISLKHSNINSTSQDDSHARPPFSENRKHIHFTLNQSDFSVFHPPLQLCR